MGRTVPFAERHPKPVPVEETPVVQPRHQKRSPVKAEADVTSPTISRDENMDMLEQDES